MAIWFREKYGGPLGRAFGSENPPPAMVRVIGDPSQTLLSPLQVELHVEEPRPVALFMVSVTFIEHLAEALCGISAVLFTFIATFSRSPRAEHIVQNSLLSRLLPLQECFGGFHCPAGFCGVPITFQSRYRWYAWLSQLLHE